MFDQKEYMKKWRKDNPEYGKEYDKQYRKDHSEHIKECKKEWRENNSKRLKEYRRQQYLRDRGKEIKQARLWQKDNPEKVKKINNRFYQKHREKILKYCKEYHKNHPEVKKQRYKEKLQYVQDYKLSKGCAICGYNKNPRLLGFHHPDDNKEFNVSEVIHRDNSLEMIKEEMDKCILLCGVCHPKLHWKLRMEEKKKLDKN